MSKDQKKTNTLNVETLENLKTVCRILQENKSSIEFWKMDKIWPINLCMLGYKECLEILNEIIFKHDVSLSHIIDK